MKIEITITNDDGSDPYCLDVQLARGVPSDRAIMPTFDAILRELRRRGGEIDYCGARKPRDEDAPMYTPRLGCTKATRHVGEHEHVGSRGDVLATWP